MKWITALAASFLALSAVFGSAYAQEPGPSSFNGETSFSVSPEGSTIQWVRGASIRGDFTGDGADDYYRAFTALEFTGNSELVIRPDLSGVWSVASEDIVAPGDPYAVNQVAGHWTGPWPRGRVLDFRADMGVAEDGSWTVSDPQARIFEPGLEAGSYDIPLGWPGIPASQYEAEGNPLDACTLAQFAPSYGEVGTGYFEVHVSGCSWPEGHATGNETVCFDVRAASGTGEPAGEHAENVACVPYGTGTQGVYTTFCGRTWTEHVPDGTPEGFTRLSGWWEWRARLAGSVTGWSRFLSGGC